ncbi:hypothetical protein [Pseudomonas sp. OV546]|uniref:hypothetical protein n=1 Tax=Pseudomonas sp. OV546 TaxID=1881063 RepID=UPI0008ECF454|nr:hypothetical protein [Pseudomonas sp. OV546]SFV12808.1 hypothetical protein SAMN05428951_119104 [Pseudomonas sp. OV546]
MKYYVDKVGVFLGGWESEPPEDSVEIESPPEYADQIWLSPGWSPSAMKAVATESAWRDLEMPKAQQNVTAIEYGEEDIPGTAQQWQKYWLALRKWSEINPDFPDSSKRPVAPS